MDEVVDALVTAAADGIAFDGLEVECGPEGYRFRTASRDLERLTESRLRDIASDSAAVSNWYFWHARAPQEEGRFSFLRWLEGLDGDEAEASATGQDGTRDIQSLYTALESGRTTTWGQLAITVCLEGGERRYEVRHVEDQSADTATLEALGNPYEAHSLTRFDDRGRYRPLRTAPTLPRGWRFWPLDPTALVTTVDRIYPATIANWYRERHGDLDVSHWRETMARQSGIYGVLETWDRGEGHDHADWVAAAHCVDSACCKRRVWEYDDETALSVDPGTGAFPCREPCSFVVAATREYLRSDPHANAAEALTEAEQDHLDDLVTTLHEEDVESVREADFGHPANRFRVRYLREKLRHRSRDETT